MKKRNRLEKGPLDLIEEAVHLLRQAPASLLAIYYLGTLPLVLGLLFFWADMSRGSFAERRLVVASLGISGLFLWMKTWQSVFAQRMLARVCGEAPRPWSWSDLWRTAATQTIAQPSGLLLLPLALVIMFPFGWACAFYQSVTVLGADERSGLRRLLSRVMQQAALWPRQNHYGLFALMLFAFFVFLNLASALVVGPFLLKTLLGVETVFSRSMAAALNSTFLAAVAGLTYLCMDPLTKTFYVLRCYYGESLRTGQDIRTELRGHAALAGGLAGGLAVALLTLGLLLPTTAAGATAKPKDNAPAAQTRVERGAGRQPSARSSPPSSSRAAIAPSALEKAMDEVISRREYNWRLPREKMEKDEEEKGPIASFMESLATVLHDFKQRVRDAIEKFLEWLQGSRTPRGPSVLGGLSWVTGLHLVLVILIVALACLVAIMVLRLWKQRRQPANDIAAQPAQALPNLADENVGADQLPEDGWSRLAREMLSQGQLRLALRAFYLASLAHLAARELVRLAPFKSNRDYERELGRRGHALPEVAQTFSQNVAVFDRVWYGLHEVNPETLDQFAGNVERLKSLSS